MIIPVWKELTDYQKNVKPPLVEAFRSTFDERKEDAKKKLGEHFDETQYPDVDDICARFALRYKFFTIAIPNADSVDPLAKAFFNEAQAQAQEDWNEFLYEAKAVLRAEMLKFVERLAEVLTPTEDGKKKRFYETTFDKLVNFLTDFSARNFANDGELREVVDACKKYLKGTNYKRMKNSDYLREKTSDTLSVVTKKLKKLAAEAPIRNVVLED
jgi:hypothetical protein